jgi:hypothetical protein
MNWAIWAKTRLPTPLSPLLERLPSWASAPYSDAPPHAAEILQGDRGDADLASAHRAADDVAHGNHVGPAGADGLGGVEQFSLGRRLARHHRKVEAALGEFEQPAGLGRVGDEALQLDPLEARRELGQRGGGDFRAGRKVVAGRRLRGDHIQALGFIGRRNPDRGDARGFAPDPG